MEASMVSWDPTTGRLSWIGIAESSLPTNINPEYAEATEVDVSDGELSNLSGVAHFSRLESLVADQNRLPDTESIPALPNLHTLSLNKNKITDILKFAADVGVKLPALAHVSLLGNPCCPSEIFGGTPEQYAEYRATLLEQLPSLRSIDFHPVTDSERPKTVAAFASRLSANKLAKGHISAKEHEHIMKVHRLLTLLDDESTDLLASSEDEGEEAPWDDDDDDADTGDDDESLPPDPTPESEGWDVVSPLPLKRDGTRSTPSPSVSPMSRLPEMSKMDSLNVFTKVVAANVLSQGAAAAVAPMRAHPNKTGAVPSQDAIASADDASDVPFLFRKVSQGSVDVNVSPPEEVNVGEATPAPPARIDAVAAELSTPPHAALKTFVTDGDGYEIPTSLSSFHTDTTGYEVAGADAGGGGDSLRSTDAKATYDANTEALYDECTLPTEPPATAQSPDEFPDVPAVPIAPLDTAPAEVTPSELHDLEVAAELGEIRTVTVQKSPTGLDLQLLRDSQYIRVAIITPRGAAHKAGLAVGDVILSCNEVGLMGATLAEAEAALVKNPSSTLRVAPSSLPVPVFDRPHSNMSSTSGFGIGARSPSHAIRPLYCEVTLPRIPGGNGGASDFGFDINTNGPDPLVATVSRGVTGIKAGDVIKSVDGELASTDNVARLLDGADDPASLDVIRYRIESTPTVTPLPTVEEGGGGAAAHDSLHMAQGAPPPAMVFDSFFAGSLTVDNLKETTKEEQLVRRASKQAIKETKASEVTKPGKVRLAITPFSIVAERMVKMSKRQKAAGVVAPIETAFSVSTSDVFSAVARKKKILLMVQPDPPKSGMCYVLKFSGAKACKRAAVACGSLPGHVAYEPPTTRVKKKAKKRSKKSTSSAASAAEAVPTFVPNLPPANAAAAAAAAPSESEGAPPRRRKLVRGANAKAAPVLPEFMSAMDAIDDLDGFLDKHSTFRGNLTGTVESNINRGQSKKWMKQYSRKAAADMLDDSDPHSTATTAAHRESSDVHGAVVDDDADDDDDDEVDEETDNEVDTEADLEFFKVLAAKREERVTEAGNRRAQLAAESARLRDELNAQRSLEMARIAQEKEHDREMDNQYKEYCITGADKRLKELTFKFKWSGGK